LLFNASLQNRPFDLVSFSFYSSIEASCALDFRSTRSKQNDHQIK